MMVILDQEREKAILKNCRINILLNDYLYKAGKLKASNCGLSFSNYIRNLISKDIEDKK